MTLYAVAAVSTSQNHGALIEQVANLGMGAPLIFAAKFTIAWPVAYHLLNGFRHLFWDMGYGFQMADLYKTGWTVVGLSFLVAAAMAAF